MSSASVACEKFKREFNRLAAEKLKVLLETKHLYQKLSIDTRDLLNRFKPQLHTSEWNSFEMLVARFLGGKFSVTDKTPKDDEPPTLTLLVGNVKLFCSACKAREAFRPILLSDVTWQLVSAKSTHQVIAGWFSVGNTFPIAFENKFQLLLLVFQCQRCEGKPETFLVKRDGLNLFIEGRSPIEQVEIPKFIPSEEEHWFGDAIVAFQSGKVLAALFYLRTFIEQFARRKTSLKDEKKTGEEIMAAYAKLLPAHLRDRMPSLAEWYDKLSQALHGAKEDSQLFKDARERVEKHFDIRRVHELDTQKLISGGLSDGGKTREAE